MPGATNSTLLVKAQNETVVALNELTAVLTNIPATDLTGIEAKLDSLTQAINGINIPATDLTGIEAKLDSLTQAINGINIPATDLTGIEQKLEDVFGTPATALTPSVRVSLNDIRDNLDAADIGLPIPGIPDVGAIGLAHIMAAMANQVFGIRDNLDTSVSDLGGSFGNILEWLGLELPGTAVGISTIHGLILIGMGLIAIEKTADDLAKQVALNSIAARLSPNNTKNLYDKECCGGGGGTGPGEDPTDNEEITDTWKCKANNFIFDTLLDSVIYLGYVGYQRRVSLLTDPNTGTQKYPALKTLDLPDAVWSQMITQGREDLKFSLANLAVIEQTAGYSPFFRYFDAKYGTGSETNVADYLAVNRQEIICEMFEATNVSGLGTVLAARINTLVSAIMTGTWVDMPDPFEELLTNSILLLLPQGLLNAAFTENDPLIPLVYAGTTDCADCGGGGGDRFALDTVSLPGQALVAGSFSGDEFTIRSALFGVQCPGIFLTNTSGRCLRVTVLSATNYTPRDVLDESLAWWNCNSAISEIVRGTSAVGHTFCVGGSAGQNQFHVKGLCESGNFEMTFSISEDTSSC